MGKKQKKKRGFFFKFFISFLILLIISFGIVAGIAFFYINDKLRQIRFY